MYIPQNKKISKLNILGIFLFAILLITIIFISGTMAALLPGFVARLTPILLFLIIVCIAFVKHSDQLLEDRTLKIWSGLLLGIMALWPTYLIVKFGALPSLDARRITAALSIMATIYMVISRKPIARLFFKELNGPFRMEGFLIVSYITWRVLSCWNSEATIFSVMQIFWEVLFYYSMFFIGGIFFHRPGLQQWMMRIFMLLAVLVSVYAGIEWLLKKNILMQLAPSNKEFAEFNLALSLERMRDGLFRAQSTFEHPLLLAEFAAMAVSFGLAAFLWGESTKAFRNLGALTLILAMIAAMLSGSRTGLLNSLVACGLVFALWLFSSKTLLSKSQQFFRKTLFFFSIAGSLAIALPIILVLAEGQSRSQITSTQARLQMLQMGWNSIAKYPFFGIGPGFAGTAAAIKTGSGVSTLDSYFLAIAIESGIPALLLLLLCLLYPFGVLFNRFMQGGQSQAAYLAALLGCIAVTLVTHAVLWMPYNFVFIFLFLGSAMAAISLDNSEKSTKIQLSSRQSSAFKRI